MLARTLRVSTSQTRNFNSFGASTTRPAHPISPHVAIYRFPLPAVTSIINRITGGSLAVGFTAIGAGVLLFGPGFAPACVAVIKSHSIIHVTMKFLVAYAGFAHGLAGIRHLYWDYTSKGLDNIAEMDASSRMIFVGSIILALIAAAI